MDEDIAKKVFFEAFRALRGRYPDAEQEAFLDAFLAMANEMATRPPAPEPVPSWRPEDTKK